MYFKNWNYLYYLIIDVENAFLNFVVDLSCSVDKGLLNIGGGLGWSLHENETMFAGKCFTFFFFDITTGLQITEKKISIIKSDSFKFFRVKLFLTDKSTKFDYWQFKALILSKNDFSP